MLAPIALFTYCRPEHTRRTVESLLKNRFVSESDLIVYSDAARTPERKQAVDAVRAYLATISGFHSVTIKHRSENYGLAKSIIQGVTEVLQKSDRIIVLEDDMVTSPHFLAYMNEALERYADDERVVSIHAYVYPVDRPLPEAFFLTGADCWGWATWRSGWACFNPDGRSLLDELKRRRLIHAFDFSGAFPNSEMLQDQVEGKNDSWAIRWHASAFLAGKLTLYPGHSLVQNIGNDGTGRHGGATTVYDATLAQQPLLVQPIPVEENKLARQAIISFFRTTRPTLIRRIAGRLRRWSKRNPGAKSGAPRW